MSAHGAPPSQRIRLTEYVPSHPRTISLPKGALTATQPRQVCWLLTLGRYHPPPSLGENDAKSASWPFGPSRCHRNPTTFGSHLPLGLAVGSGVSHGAETL